VYIPVSETKKPFTAWLKEERNCWAMLIEEMRAGKLVAEATKDFTAISQAIQNVLLVDAIVRRYVWVEWDLAERSERSASIPKVTGSNPTGGSDLTFCC
jgi:hypothetical protein